MLVCSVSDQSLRVVRTGSTLTNLSSIPETQKDALYEKMASIKSSVNEFVEQAKAYDCDNVFVFGTEAVRRIQDKHLYDLSTFGFKINVLARKAEAFFSLVAAVKGLLGNMGENKRILILDLGSSSMEIAGGKIAEGVLSMETYKSYKLGSEELVSLLKDTRKDFRKFENKIQKRIQSYEQVQTCFRPDHVVLLGSVASNATWLLERLKFEEVRNRPYDPKRINGKRVSVREMDSFVSSLLDAFSKDEHLILKFLGYGKEVPEEFEKIVTGLVTISAVLRMYNVESFQVSGQGTRYGVAWVLATEGNEPCDPQTLEKCRIV